MRNLTINGRQEKIPPFPHHKDYIYRCRNFFEAKSALSFMSIARFRAVKETFNGWRFGCGIPRDILIDPTNACNLSCIGCWAHDYDTKSSLSYDKLDSLFTEAEKLGAMDILYTGGEPMLRKDDLIRLAARHRKLFFGIFTNGTLIDAEFVSQLKALGNMTVFISIEGFEDDTDFRRGTGTYERVMSAMDLLKNEGIAFGFSLCYHSRNYNTVSSTEFLNFLAEKGAWFGWAFGYRPVGQDADMSLCLNAQQRDFVRKALTAYSEKTGITVIDLFNSGHKAYGCVAAGSGYIHITANGDVEPCAFCHYSDANINDMSLRQTLQSPFFRKFRRMQPFSDNPLQPCPMVDVPEAIVELTESTGAKSTHLRNPETARQFAEKITPFAREWEQYIADGHAEACTKAEGKRFNFLKQILKLRKTLAGDLKD
jgi:MoaA/NifB/PqqE/SkfB family radical SAM enzyme